MNGLAIDALPVATTRRCAVTRWRDDTQREELDAVAEEVPVALVYNGVSHAVLLASPCDLHDLALGFSLTEGILSSPRELYDIEVVPADHGVEVRMDVAAARMTALRERRRTMAGRTGCGLCGVESLREAVRPPNTVRRGGGLSACAIDRAMAGLAARQELHRETGAVHAAGWARWNGDLRMAREDVGRHNALDKLLGALARSDVEIEDGFVVVTSRASYEMVHKAAARGVQLLAAVSAPTALAIRMAEGSGITLVGFAAHRRHVAYAHAGRIVGGRRLEAGVAQPV